MLSALPVSLAVCCAAPPVPSSGSDELQVEARTVIALHDATAHEGVQLEDPVAQLIEMPLQHLGLVVRRWPVADGPPPAAWLAEARGVITCFADAEIDASNTAWLAPWLVEAIEDHGLRVVVVGEKGPLARVRADGGLDDAGWRRVARAMGLEPSGAWGSDPLMVSVETLGPELCAVEAPVLSPIHRGPVRPPAEWKVWVETRDASMDEVCTPVVSGPRGGLALNPYVLSSGQGLGDRRWHLDLFEFLKGSLGVEGWPVPDPCVVSGRRAFFVQVDGDGFESLSTAGRGAYAARVFLEEVIDRFELPMTVSIIVASVTPRLDAPLDADARIELAREILTRPNVEVASHGVLHPLKWNQPLLPDSPPKTITWYGGLDGYEYSPKAEVVASLEFIDRILEGTGRRCETMLWTGDAVPAEEVLSETRRRRVANVNGATFRWDDAWDSIGYVKPLVRFEGQELQVLCGAANENVFEGFFDQHPGAFRHIAKTIRRTGSPRILKPANVYIHFYAAEQPERLASIQDLIHRFGEVEETTPIFASQFHDAARDAFTTARFAKAPDGRWALAGLGRCRTVRFDDEPRGVDLERSFGVLGWRHIGDALYVHLAEERAIVALGGRGHDGPYLVQANYPIEGGRRSRTTLSWQAVSFAPRTSEVAGLAAGGSVQVTVGGRVSHERADDDGRLRVELGPGQDRIEVRLP